MNKYVQALEILSFDTTQIQDDVHLFNILNAKRYCETIIQELVDKATPKKVIRIAKETRVLYSTTIEYIYYCPTCKTILWKSGMGCPNNDCRQAIDWSKNLE